MRAWDNVGSRVMMWVTTIIHMIIDMYNINRYTLNQNKTMTRAGGGGVVLTINLEI